MHKWLLAICVPDSLPLEVQSDWYHLLPDDQQPQLHHHPCWKSNRWTIILVPAHKSWRLRMGSNNVQHPKNWSWLLYGIQECACDTRPDPRDGVLLAWATALTRAWPWHVEKAMAEMAIGTWMQNFSFTNLASTLSKAAGKQRAFTHRGARVQVTFAYQQSFAKHELLL